MTPCMATQVRTDATLPNIILAMFLMCQRNNESILAAFRVIEFLHTLVAATIDLFLLEAAHERTPAKATTKGSPQRPPPSSPRNGNPPETAAGHPQDAAGCAAVAGRFPAVLNPNVN